MDNDVDSKKLQKKLDVANRLLEELEMEVKHSEQYLDKTIQLLEKHVVPVVDALRALKGTLFDARQVVDLAEKGTSSFERDSKKVAEFQEFSQQLAEEAAELKKKMDKDKSNAQLKKEFEIKERAMIKAKERYTKADEELEDRVRAVEIVSESFDDYYLKPIYKDVAELKKWAEMVEKVAAQKTVLDSKWRGSLEERIRRCENALK